MARAEREQTKSKRAIAAIAGLAILAACQQSPPAFEGKVTDNFGRPLDGVVVAVANSPTVTSSDAGGSYRLPHTPSRVVLQFIKDGYAFGETTVEGKPGNLEVPPVQLFKLLKSQGWWLVADDYRSLNSCTLTVRQDRDPNGGVTDVYLYQQDPTPLRGTGTKLTFLDNTTPVPGEEMRLFAVTNVAEVMSVGPRGRRASEVPLTPLTANAPFGRWFVAEVALGTAYVYLPVNADGVPIARGGGRCFAIQPR
ncbi:MAG: carboxypeptidase-like regulatory domain-containing protein [Bauldia sp.]